MIIEELCRTDQERIGRWAYGIQTMLGIYDKSDMEAADAIMSGLSDVYGVRFGDDCKIWVTLLVKKWRAKTPDVKQQAESIALAIFIRYTPITPPS